MEHRALGASPIRVSRVIFGSMGFNTAQMQSEARIELVREAIEAGIDTIDTAPLYDFGDGERFVGKAIAGLEPRPTVLTKVGLRWDTSEGDTMFETDYRGTRLTVRKNSRPESIIWEIDQSRERLGLERLDLVQVHQRDYATPVDETMSALADAYRAGTIRAIGVSNFEPDDIARARKALRDIPLASVQSQYNLLSQSAPELAQSRVSESGFLAYSPLAQGLLTGRYDPDCALDEGDWRHMSPMFSRENRARIHEALECEIRPIAKREGVSISAVVLAWVLAQEGLSAVVAGASSTKQLKQNVVATELTLTRQEVERIGAVFGGLRFVGLERPSRLRRAVGKVRGLLKRVGI